MRMCTAFSQFSLFHCAMLRVFCTCTALWMMFLLLSEVRIAGADTVKAKGTPPSPAVCRLPSAVCRLLNLPCLFLPSTRMTTDLESGSGKWERMLTAPLASPHYPHPVGCSYPHPVFAEKVHAPCGTNLLDW